MCDAQNLSLAGDTFERKYSYANERLEHNSILRIHWRTEIKMTKVEN